MARLIDDLMEVSRITRGKIELRPEVLALDEVVADAVDLSRPLLNGARHELETAAVRRIAESARGPGAH